MSAVDITKNRGQMYAGISLFFCFCLLSAAQPLTQYVPEEWAFLVHFCIDAAGFLLPILLLKSTVPMLPKLRLHLNITAPEVLYFMAWASIAVAAAGLLFDYLLAQSYSANWLSILREHSIFAVSGTAMELVLCFSIVLPILQTLYLHGVLFSVQESYAGTAFCMMLSGICYLLLPNFQGNAIGAFLLGVFCTYMTYEFDCVWPAMIAQITVTLYRSLLLWVADTYGAFGAWKYFPALSVLVVLLGVHMSCRFMTILLESKRIQHFQPTRNRIAALQLIFNLGTATFVLAVVVKNILQI